MRCNQTEDIPTNKKVGTHIVIMLIEVWKIGDMLKYMDEPPNNRAPVLLAECESFQVQENYRQTVCGMELKLPKGTMLLRTIANEKDVEDAELSEKRYACHSSHHKGVDGSLGDYCT